MYNFNQMFMKEAKEDKAAVKAVNVAASKARECLNLKPFQEYAKSYVAAEARMVQAMMMTTESYMKGSFGLNEYASKMLVYMTKLKDLRSLLDGVNAAIRAEEKANGSV